MANASLEGRSTVDQYEIAKEVLGRSAEFNPWDDATVRKLATRLRQKLDEYDAGSGRRGCDCPLATPALLRSQVPAA